MDALTLRSRTLLQCLAMIVLLPTVVQTTRAASWQSVNFAVTADHPDVAEKVGKAAEVYRRQLAIFWLGKPLPNWSRPCRISVREGSLGAGGQTTFQFARGEVLNWRMQVQGTLERILDSVLPHEINHTIFACHFRRPLPRWADEGAATLFEHRSEQLKQLALLNEVVRNKSELISLRDLLSMKEYPKGQRPMLTLYAQGYALADFLVQQKGRQAYLKFISDGERGGWEQAIQTNFDHEGIESLERNWRGWVLAGMPKLTLPRDQMLAAVTPADDAQPQETARPELPTANGAQPVANRQRRRLTNGDTVRSQSPDPALKDSPSGSIPAPSIAQSVKSESADSGIAPPGTRRRFSFQAPVPKRKTSVSSQNTEAYIEPSPQRSGKPASEEDESAAFSQADEDRLFGMSSPHEFPERSALLVARPNAGRNSDSEVSAGVLEFSGVLLPAERNVTSGSTPQWARFPGQKKLF